MDERTTLRTIQDNINSLEKLGQASFAAEQIGQMNHDPEQIQAAQKILAQADQLFYSTYDLLPARYQVQGVVPQFPNLLSAVEQWSAELETKRK